MPGKTKAGEGGRVFRWGAGLTPRKGAMEGGPFGGRAWYWRKSQSGWRVARSKDCSLEETPLGRNGSSVPVSQSRNPCALSPGVSVWYPLHWKQLGAACLSTGPEDAAAGGCQLPTLLPAAGSVLEGGLGRMLPQPQALSLSCPQPVY